MRKLRLREVSQVSSEVEFKLRSFSFLKFPFVFKNTGCFELSTYLVPDSELDSSSAVFFFFLTHRRPIDKTLEGIRRLVGGEQTGRGLVGR